jgi:hypothetical protein
LPLNTGRHPGHVTGGWFVPGVTESSAWPLPLSLPARARCWNLSSRV